MSQPVTDKQRIVSELQLSRYSPPPFSQIPLSRSTCRRRSAIIRNDAVTVRYKGPQHWMCDNPLLYFRILQIMYIFSKMRIARVIPNDISCPSTRAAAEAEPLSNPIMRAGQHQAPRSAGIERMSVISEMISPFLSPPAPSSSSCSASVSFCCWSPSPLLTGENSLSAFSGFLMRRVWLAHHLRLYLCRLHSVVYRNIVEREYYIEVQANIQEMHHFISSTQEKQRNNNNETVKKEKEKKYLYQIVDSKDEITFLKSLSLGRKICDWSNNYKITLFLFLENKCRYSYFFLIGCLV